MDHVQGDRGQMLEERRALFQPGFPLRYHYDSGLTPNAENKDACFTVTSLYIGAFPG